jgi:hypothetical protein
LEKYRNSLSVSEIEDVAAEISHEIETSSEEYLSIGEDETFPLKEKNENNVGSGYSCARLDSPVKCSQNKNSSSNKSLKSYRNFLMMSEWMIDAPSDFPDKWILTVCPIGKRVTVVSSAGRTRCYSRNGDKFLSESFPSNLPGGGRFVSSKGNSIIDCIYVDRDKTFYVLDLILWNSVSFFGCDTDFRFYWLKTKFEDETLGSSGGRKSTGSNSIGNKFTYKFKLLKRSEASKESIVKTVEDFEKDFNDETEADEGCASPEVKNERTIEGGKKNGNSMQGNQEEVMEGVCSQSQNPSSQADKSASPHVKTSRSRVEIDGLLFFHREGLYASGTTPLVLWLKTHMLNEVLGITVDDKGIGHPAMEVDSCSAQTSRRKKVSSRQPNNNK